MNIYSLLKRGYNHKDFCEDNQLIKINRNWIIAAVFDGCSSGIESYFASSLFKKIFDKNIELFFNQNFSEKPEDAIKFLLSKFVIDIEIIARNLNLKTDELLSTIILLVINTSQSNGSVIAIGDGVISINGKVIEIDQNNVPDYFAYSIFESGFNFENWFKNHKQIYHFTEIEDISISTDGILSFEKDNTPQPEQIQILEPVNYLLHDTYLINNKAMLSRKYNLLRTNAGLSNFDDVSIVRVLNLNPN